MNNEIGRKITSLTLMAIMVAGGLTFAVPGAMPVAHAANANLFVSAENSQFDNYMSGPQVIEVVVIDSDINDTDESKGEPDVTVNGNQLRMVQAVDGNWYGYFADYNQAVTADGTTDDKPGEGLDFGTICDNDAAAKDAIGIQISEADGFARNDHVVAGNDGLVDCSADYNDDDDTKTLNVLREAKSLNMNVSGNDNNTNPPGVKEDAWPFIQLYEFNPTGNVVVQYNKGGGAQTTTLTFDTVDQFADISLDRSVYPLGSNVHVTITDLWLNIDPTDEDSWTFGTLDGELSTSYQVFNENGGSEGVSKENASQDNGLTAALSDLMCEDNCVLILDTDVQGTGVDVIGIRSNDDSDISKLSSLDLKDQQPITITEQGPNSGVFGTYDESDKSVLVITDKAKRGTSASLDYNESATTVLVGFDFATVDIQPIDDTWNSGEAIPIVIVDGDANKNSRVDEDLDLNDPNVSAIPTLTTGIPFTLEDAKEVVFFEVEDTNRERTIQSLIDRGVINPTTDTTTIQSLFDQKVINPTTDTTTIQSLIDSGRIQPTTETTTVQSLIDRGVINPTTDTTIRSFLDRGVIATTTETTIQSLIDRGAINLTTERTIQFLIDKGVIDAPTTETTIQSLIDIGVINATTTETTIKSLADAKVIDAPTTETTIKSLADADGVNTAIQSLFDPEITDRQIIELEEFSQRGIINTTNVIDAQIVFIDLGATLGDLKATIHDPRVDTNFNGFNLLNLDIRSLADNNQKTDVYLHLGDLGNQESTLIQLEEKLDAKSLTVLDGYNNNDTNMNIIHDEKNNNQNIGIVLVADNSSYKKNDGDRSPIAVDFFSFGFIDDGVQSIERIANQIVRIEAEETGDNTSTFEGSLEYVMLNQLNILDEDTYSGLTPIANDPSFIVIEDLTDEDAPRVNYNDRGADGVVTPVSDQQAAPSHSGVVSLNQDSYKTADTVVITLEDLDLNVDSDLIDIFTVVTDDKDNTFDQVGRAGLPTGLSFGDLGRLLDITYDDVQWRTYDTCINIQSSDTGLSATGFSLIETGSATGVFVGNFQIPSDWCRADGATSETTTGLDIEVNYVDFRDASGEIVEVGDSAGVRANTGSVSLDRTVYPVPFGTPDDFNDSNNNAPEGRSLFPIHASGIKGDDGIRDGEFLQSGDLTIHVRVNDPDFDINPSGEDSIDEPSDAAGNGPIQISVIRGSDTVILGTAGSDAQAGRIAIGDDLPNDPDNRIRNFGPLNEIAPDAGIYELDVVVKFTDGPASTTCPNNVVYEKLVDNGVGEGDEAADRFDIDESNNPYRGEDFCILQGDILQVEYTDPADASGDRNTVTDSATFDLRNGVLQSDKSVYIIGSDMILTLIEPDFDLDNDAAETYDLDLIEWDSDAATVSMGNIGGQAGAFDPEPTDIRETGDSTGIFQVVIEIPEELENDRLERGEEITLEYTDWGPSGSDYVGDEDEDVNLTIYTSNFGATVELDQKVYTWTDKVYITIVAPDHNFDSDLIDEIGADDEDPIEVSTRSSDLANYRLVETGTDTGIFTGEVILTGFAEHDANGDGDGNDASGMTSPANGGGPTDGFLATDDDDGLTVSFEFSEDETIVGSALIRWNIGEVQWLEASYPASGTGVVRIIDPDMNLDPEAVDNFDVDVWSDSDSGGIDLTVTETNEATGIFEGTVFFTVDDNSSGHRLRVSEGDTVTAEYEDNTLPDPYTTADELDITATSLIGTIVPPLERAPAANLRVVDAFDNSLDAVSVDQQVQITADLANGQDRDQSFAYLLQVQDANGVTVSLSWITGSLSSGQSFSPAVSWIPTNTGTYTATVFVWESVDNPTALSPPVSTTVNVS